MVAWGIEFHGGVDVSPSWIELVFDVSMVPAGRAAAGESSGWRYLRWEAVHPFAWFCARGGCGGDALGADGRLPGRCCAASV